MKIHELNSPKGARKRRKVVGRGAGSGHGKTSGRGHTGQGARAGRGILQVLEGGQSRLMRRLPKVGFRPKNPTIYQIINLESLNKFSKDAVVSAEALKSKGLIKSLRRPYKILGKGELKKPLVIQAKNVSESAKKKIESAGGKVELFENKEKAKKEEVKKA